MTYVLPDHQDSFAHLVTSAGTNDVTESFTAYGNRRSGSTWSGPPSSNDETAINAVSRWGYTGETMLGVSMGLVDLNGRVEDATIGRFLSADPYIPDPENAQSFNRYGYVNNNPLTYVDPSGFDSQNSNGHGGNEPCGAVAQDRCQNPPGLGIQQLATIPVYGSRLPSGVSSTSITLTPVGSGSGGGVEGGGGGGGSGGKPNPQPNSQGCHNNGLFVEAGRALIAAGQWVSNIGGETATAGADIAEASALASAVGIPAEQGIAFGVGVAGVGGGESLAGSALQYAGGILSQNPAAIAGGFLGMTRGAAEGIAFAPLGKFGVPGLPSGIPDPVDAASAAAAAAASSSGGGSCP